MEEGAIRGKFGVFDTRRTCWVLGIAEDREGECYEIVNIVYVQRLQQSEKARESISWSSIRSFGTCNFFLPGVNLEISTSKSFDIFYIAR